MRRSHRLGQEQIPNFYQDLSNRDTGLIKLIPLHFLLR